MLTDDQVIFYNATPNALIFLTVFIIALALTFFTIFISFSGELLRVWDQNVMYLSGSILLMMAICLCILVPAIFAPFLWERRRISKMNTNEIESLIEKGSKRKPVPFTTKLSWHLITNAVLNHEGQVQFTFTGMPTKINARLIQIHSEEVSSTPPQLQLRDFLIEKLGARLQVLNQ